MEKKTISVFKDELLSFLYNSSYSENRIKAFKYEFIKLEEMMKIRNIQYYTPQVGGDFFELRTISLKSESSRYRVKSFVHKLNCLCEGRPISKHYTSDKSIPNNYMPLLSCFVESCISKGNAKGTVYNKKQRAIDFFNTLELLGCHSIDDLTHEIVLKACAKHQGSVSRASIKCLLHYAFTAGFVKIDFSPIVPLVRSGSPTPTVYSLADLKKIEETARMQEGICAKRDLAVILIALRYGFRSGDICRLTKDNFDFVLDRISFIQQKTSESVDVILYTDVKEAILDYLSEPRPSTESQELFLSATPPYKALSRAGIYHIINHAFKNAGIDTKGKHHGAHALRSSNASLKINSGMTYTQAKQSIGWSDRNVIKHYAKIDIENLRMCALEAFQITNGSFFERFLQGSELL